MNQGKQKRILDYQPSLFEPQIQTPVWNELAPEIRATATNLFAQIMRAHWEYEDERPFKEADDE